MFDSLQDLHEMLKRLNNTLNANDVYIDLYVTGGSSILFSFNDRNIKASRQTSDIDYVNVISSQHLRDLLSEYEIEFAGMFTDAVPFEDYVESSTLYSFSNELSHIDIYVPDLEIVFTNKAMSTRQKDLEDCYLLIDHVDIKNCEERIEELLSYQAYLNPDMNIFTLIRQRLISINKSLLSEIEL